jgi:serine/threonine-protein kinase/endoribonuclease IRE1
LVSISVPYRSKSTADGYTGSGSQGTTVHKGDFEGRSVAVKRILRTHADIAMKEVKTLQDTDYHQNIVRYYCQQVYGQFLYIALERCPGSLYDVITLPRHSELRAKMDPRETLLQIAKGLHHLHTLKIVHRDVKPQNILVGEPKTAHQHPRLLISDFGLCKKLQADEYSFGATTAHGAGTIGWRAPELLGDVAREPGERDNSGSGTGTGSDVAVEDPITKRRATRAIDIFALGCVYYFVLTGGDHPFGNRYAREYNIMKGMSEEKTLHDKYFMGLEAVDLVGNMIRANPKQRYVSFDDVLLGRGTNWIAGRIRHGFVLILSSGMWRRNWNFLDWSRIASRVKRKK